MSVTTPTEPAARGRFVRLAGHVGWSALDHLARLGLTRLVCFPMAAKLLGDSEFGQFVLALAIATIFGGAVAQGFISYILRNISGLHVADQASAKRACIAMTLVATLVVFAIVLLFGPMLSPNFQSPEFRFWLAVFAVHYVFLNPSETILSIARIDRDFRQIAVVHAAGAIGMLLCLLLFPAIGRWAIVLGILVWAILPLWLTRRLIPPGEGWFDAAAVRKIVGVAVAISVASAVQLSSGYLDRVILAIWWPSEEVSAFFAAISLGLLFTTPGLILSTLILSLLAKLSGPEQFTTKFLLVYAAGVIALAVGVFLIGRPMGAYVLEFFYPAQFRNAIGLWDYAVGSAAGLTIIALTRPFILKFRPATWLPALSIIALATRMPLLLTMVPNGGRTGAAKALCLGSAIIAGVWLCVFLHFAISRRPGAAESPDITTARSES